MELEGEKPEEKVYAEPQVAQQQFRGEGANAGIQHQDCVDAKKLQELEDGISKAQDSYHKIEQKVCYWVQPHGLEFVNAG